MGGHRPSRIHHLPILVTDMAFVTFKTELGARQVDMVYATQAEANSAAAQNPNLTAHTGNVNEDVNPGDYINSAGALLSAPPAAIQHRDERVQHKAEVRDVFNAWVERRNDWQTGLGLDDNHEDALKAADRWAYHACATADALVDFNYLPSLSLTNRNSFIEHIIKALRDDDRDAYDRFLSTKTARDAWSAVNCRDGQQIYSDMLSGTPGVPQDPDGSFTALGSTITIPTGFDPSRETLRDT